MLKTKLLKAKFHIAVLTFAALSVMICGVFLNLRQNGC